MAKKEKDPKKVGFGKVVAVFFVEDHAQKPRSAQEKK